MIVIRQQTQLRILLIVVIASFFTIVGLSIVVAQNNNVQTILGPYPEQKIVSVGRNVVTIEAKLCATKTVQVETTLSFQAFSPPYRYPQDSIPGAFINFASGIHQTRKAGCTVFAGANALHNPILPAVYALDKTLLQHKWRVVGKEVVISDEQALSTVGIYSQTFGLLK